MPPLTRDHTKLLRITSGLIVDKLRGRVDCAALANHFKDCDKQGFDIDNDDRDLCICELPEQPVRPKVWFGQYGLDGELRFWAGLSGRGSDMLDSIANVPCSYEPTNTLSKEDYGERFAKTLKGDDFGKMFQQPFGSARYWLGFYHPTPVGDQADYSNFILKAVEMLTDIARRDGL